LVIEARVTRTARVHEFEIRIVARVDRSRRVREHDHDQDAFVMNAIRTRLRDFDLVR